MLFLVSLLIFCTATGVFTEDHSQIIQTHLGGIEGSIKTTYSGRKYAGYEGIPYALPPTLERRFQPPEPITAAWSGNFSATQSGRICIQNSYPQINDTESISGDEDCLFLNVYVPLVTQKRLAVLFMVHGGAFRRGSSSTGVKFLMDKDIIVVTMNYRLGIFGFLSTEDDVVPGNMGLKDQSLALRWTSKNIEYFGGDPKKITLVGFSAGGSAVHYHYLSPLSRGLFQNGISFSGTAFGPGKQVENSREKAIELGSLLKCPTTNTSEMIMCLREMPAESILEKEKYFMPWRYNPLTPFGPVVEKSGDKPFVDRSPIEIISSGNATDLLWITGLVSKEGLAPSGLYVNNDTILNDMDANWESLAPYLLDYEYTIPQDKQAVTAKKIRNHYLGTNPIDRNTTQSLIHLIGDRLYAIDGEKAARWQAKINKSPVYFWYYSYRGSTSASDHLSNSTNNYGVCHGDDFGMLFEKGHTIPLAPRDRAVQEKMIDFVVSVAEKGIADFGPNVTWTKFNSSKEETEFLHIAASDDIKMQSDSNFAQKRFWSTIDFDENKLPPTESDLVSN